MKTSSFIKRSLCVELLCILFLISCTKYNTTYKAGTYIGQAEGYHSAIVVEVIVDSKQIQSIEVLEHKETPILADIVINEIPGKVIKQNSTQVDIVSGATYTSKTLLEAINNALEDAYKEE